MSTLNRPLSFLGRGGVVLEKKLKSIGIESCKDLIFYFPRRFDDFSKIVSIHELCPHMIATIHGRIDMISNRRSRNKRMIVTEALVTDHSGSVRVVWFNQPFLTKNLSVGDQLSLSGKTNDLYYDLQLVSPAYERLRGSETVHTGRLTPVYSLPATIFQKQFRGLMRVALDACLAEVTEWLPDELREQEEIPELALALESIHFPENQKELEAAQKRFKFDELFLLQLVSASLRQALSLLPAPSIPFDQQRTKELITSLPFSLTREQRSVAWEILCDMKRMRPMNRLVQGDVGSGKTIVAAIAILNAVRARYQCALIAPTEVLAQQHFQTLRGLFNAFHVRIALLTARATVFDHASSSEIREHIRDGMIDIVIGTHALIQERIQFSALGLAVIDEQHRFGVKQRKTLREKNISGMMPHLLSLTATPIPRSLALTVYGDLDCSTIRMLPRGRKKIITKIVPQSYREWTYQFIRKEIAKGRQAFVLCPLINKSDSLGVRSVAEEYKKLTKGPFKDLRVALLHGKMSQRRGKHSKEDVMTAFRDHTIDILITTSVIEVGIDVPNANVIFIEGAERFGLAQLHQLRGRVGRAEHQSYCFLAPSDEDKEEIERLKAVIASNDGFALAEKDLELRGEGDIYGLRQSGMPRLQIATLFDTELIQKARHHAQHYGPQLYRYPELFKRVDTFQQDLVPGMIV